VLAVLGPAVLGSAVLSAQAGAPYPPSPVITGIDWHWSTLSNAAPGSDNWVITWADDEHQYTSWGDGGGFCGTGSDGRVSMGVARVEGGKTGYSCYNVWGGKNPENPVQFSGKSYGILSLHGTMYMWRCGSGSDASAFTIQDLYKSTNHCATWSATGVEYTPSHFDGADGFFAATFCQFGRDYADARDAYVYSYAPENKDGVWDVQIPGEITLMRARTNLIEQQSRYEYFAGFDPAMRPTWTTNINARVPTFRDSTNGVMRTSVCYDAGIKRYLLVTQQVDRHQTENGHIGIYDAPEPWGPWTTVLFTNCWDEGLQTGSKTVYWNFSSKWFGPNGTNFVLVYTGKGADEWGTLEGSFVVSELAKAPYPLSPVVTGIEWEPASNIVRKATGSDNWPLTWADDDNMYTTYGDGWGFEPKVETKLSLGFAKVLGPATNFSGVNIRSATGEQTGGGGSGKKASGILMVNGTLYIWVRNANNSGEQCQLAWSTDYAETWTWNAWKFEELGHPCFLNFGKHYAGARDGYVYMYSPDTPSAYDETDTVVLSRVPTNQILVETAYEFVSGFDGGGVPQWSTNIAERAAVFAFAGGCNRMDVTYNAALGRYMMTMRSRAQAGGLNQFSVYDAPEPWGPWTTVYYTEQWEGGPLSTGNGGWGEVAHIPRKWIAPDGQSFYLVFAGDDAFAVRKATLTVSIAPQTETEPPDQPTGLSVQ